MSKLTYHFEIIIKLSSTEGVSQVNESVNEYFSIEAVEDYLIHKSYIKSITLTDVEI